MVELEPGAFGSAARLTLKLELLQHTGSFKPRGAFNAMLAADGDEDRLELGAAVVELAPARSLPGDHQRVVEGMQLERSGGLGPLVRIRQGVVVERPGDHHLGGGTPQAFDLRGR